MGKDIYSLGGEPGRYTHVLLYRHGQTDPRPGRAESQRGLSPDGVDAVRQVARRLAEEVSTGRRAFRITAVRHGEYRQVRQTLNLVRQAVQSQDPTAWPAGNDAVNAEPALNPDVFWMQTGRPDVKSLRRKDWNTKAPGMALLIIGHEPQLSEITREVLSLPPRQVVTPPGGVSALQLRGRHWWNRPRLCWLIEPTDKDTTELLRKKIGSKMDVAKVFGAVITFALGVILNVLVDNEKTNRLPEAFWVKVAAGALGLALVLYVAVLYAYDSLLMPSRFWGTARRSARRGRRVAARPPSSQNLVLQQNMVWIWSRPFTLANILVVLAFGLLAWGGIGIPGGVVIGATVIAVGLAFWARRVNLGVQD